jgi:hypothetical protein
MSQTRWEQIHRYLTFNMDPQAGEGPGSSFFDKIEPVASMIRTSCQQAAVPASWVTVDEAMVPYKGRSNHTVKILGKPVSEGYKIWVLSCRGAYIVDWLFHSRTDGAQECLHRKAKEYLQPVPFNTVRLAETYQVPIRLMEKLVSRHSHTKWLLFLDNLFLTIDVAHVLLVMGIGVMGTTRKTSTNMPHLLQKVKDINTALLYGGLLMIQWGWVLCFAWQDNNTVLGITTSYSLHRAKEDFIIKDKWRPKETSTNYHIAKSVFGSEKRKCLPIPMAINDYNHGMNGTDNNNQLRGTLSCHQRFEQRTWRPLGYWLFDVVLSNTFALWRLQQSPQLRASCREHEIFEKAVISGLLRRGPPHLAVARIGKRSRCRWGILMPGECVQGTTECHDDESIIRRPVLAETTGNAPRRPPVRRPRNVRSGCIDCNVSLCIDRNCFYNFHMYLHDKTI